MRDPEFIEMRNKFILGMTVLILFGIPFLIFITRKFMVETSPILKGIDNAETMIVFVEKADCSNCKMVNDTLKSYGIKYKKINSSSDRNYGKILHKLDITTTDIDEPTLMYIDEGKYYAALVSIKSEEEVVNFLVTYGYLDAEKNDEELMR